MLAQTSTSKQDAALFAEMLSLPNDGRYPTFDLDSRLRRQRTLDALFAWTEQWRGKNGPNDLRGCALDDPRALSAGSADRPYRDPTRTVACAFRPEFQAPSIGRPHVTSLTINRLAAGDVHAMIDHVIGNKSLQVSIRQDIIERTDGIPLFVEEMTKAVLEAESEGDARRTAAALPSPALAAPGKLTRLANGNYSIGSAPLRRWRRSVR